MTSAPAEPFLPLGAPVRFRWLDGGPRIAEVAPQTCPGCGAAWGPGKVQLGHAGQRTYRCGACTGTFRADPAPRDRDGLVVITGPR